MQVADMVISWVWRSPPSVLLLLLLGPLILPHMLFEMLRRWWRGAPRRVPRNTEPLLELPATELADRIKRGALSSRALTDMCIAQLQRVNPALNALCATRYDAARAEADAADEAVKQGTVPTGAALWVTGATLKHAHCAIGTSECASLTFRACRS